MKLGLRYESAYRYEQAVGFSPHEIRLFPRIDRFARLRRFDFKASGASAVRYSRDVFDNVVAICFFSERARELRFNLEIDLDLEGKNAFDFILDSDAAEMPFIYSPALTGVLAPFLRRQTSGVLSIPNWNPPEAEHAGTVSSLVALNHALHEGIGYERREKGTALSPAETLQLGRGACRDVAVLLAEILRQAGLAARLVSGYLRGADEKTRHAEGSLHAWTEVFLPGAGWIGMDATNGVFTNHNFIAAAVGLTPADITPIAGAYYQKDGVPNTMTSRLTMSQL